MKFAMIGILLVGSIRLGATWGATPEEIVQEQVEAYNARDLQRFVGLYSEDAAIRKLLTGELVGQGAVYFRQRYSERFQSSPDLHATIHDRIALGKFVLDHEEVVQTRSEPTVSALAVYRVGQSKIDDVWFAFGEEVKLDAAEATRAGMARHATTVTDRDAATYEDTFSADARIVNLADGRIVCRDRTEIMARIRPFLEGRRPFSWRIEQQIVFGNLIVNLEEQKVDNDKQEKRRLVIYEFTHGRITGCWVIPG
jgi:hypothetical protein